MKKKLLFISHRLPYPPDKGERIRAFQEIVALAEHFSITLAAPVFSHDQALAAEALRRWCERLELVGAGHWRGLLRGAMGLLRGRSVTEGYFSAGPVARRLAGMAQSDRADLVLGYSSGTLPLVLSVAAKAKAMDLVDVDSLKWDQYAAASRGLARWLYRRESLGVARLERQAVDRCHAVFVVSQAEAAALPLCGQCVQPVANGVDADYFQPPGPAGYADSGKALVFAGTMSYRPNVQAVQWFVKEVWPALRRTWPQMQFRIVGRDPAAAVRRLAQVPGVRVTGTVPDVRPHLSDALAAVAPLQLARGVQNKVLEAMAMGKAVVASSAALEGLEVQVGHNVLQADRPEQWMQCIGRLIRDEPHRRQVEHNARLCVVSRYNWRQCLAPMVAACCRLADSAAKDLPAAGQLCA